MNDCTFAYYADFYLKKKKKNEKYVIAEKGFVVYYTRKLSEQ